MINIGLVGFGYWGPNLARNFTATEGCVLSGICDMNPECAKNAAAAYPQAKLYSNAEEMCTSDNIDVVLIATPVHTHHPIALQALRAGKDVFIEKPMTTSVAEAEELIAVAKENDCIIAVDHTFLFTGAVNKIKEMSDSGELGDLLYFDSVRVNLGLFQQDVNVIYDLAPHDLSILCHIYDMDPISVQAMGVCHAENKIENIAYLHLEYPGGVVAHLHLNWLSPVKIRRTIIGCSDKMVVYDDLEATEKIKVYDKGITVLKNEETRDIRVDYRVGDVLVPKLSHYEALAAEAKHFISCVAKRERPLVDGNEGLRVVKILEACQKSLANGFSKVAL